MSNNADGSTAAILRYARRRWHVLPVYGIASDGQCACGKANCADVGKHPLRVLADHGVKQATASAFTISSWWSAFPSANVGIATGETSGLCVVDVDARSGGLDTLATLVQQHGELPPTPTVLTGGGGRHVYFRFPGRHLKNRSGVLPGIDLKCCGGSVVAPPSVHVSGEHYRWADGLGPNVVCAEMPDWLLALLSERQRVRSVHVERSNGYAAAALADEVETVALATVGTRHDILNTAAFKLGGLVAGGELVESEVERALTDAALATGLDEREIERTIRAGIRDGTHSPRTAPEHNRANGRLAESVHVQSVQSAPAHDTTWPAAPDDAAFYGLAGDISRAIAPHTEADPMALLVQVLGAFGNAIGRSAHFYVEDDRHAMNENVVLVGATAKGRKGSSWSRVRRVFELADSEWVADHVQSGLSSGEGLTWAVRDPIVKQEAVREKGRPTGEYVEVVTDPGVQDKRLLVLEAEFALVLKVLARDGNTLSAVIRHAWDHGNLRSMTKNSPARATNAHISMIGHITRDELLRYLDETEAGNGFGNRFLWIAVQRSKLLPRGAHFNNVNINTLVQRLNKALGFARVVGELTFDDDANEIWDSIYPELSEAKPGMLGSMIARGEAHTKRFASIYALLDESSVVRPEHLKAALALWDYAEASALWIFGSNLGDPIADEILTGLRHASPSGLTRTDISALFDRNKNKAQLGRALDTLSESGLVRMAKEVPDGGTGRHITRWFAI
jgi:hypothetical protein